MVVSFCYLYNDVACQKAAYEDLFKTQFSTFCSQPVYWKDLFDVSIKKSIDEESILQDSLFDRYITFLNTCSVAGNDQLILKYIEISSNISRKRQLLQRIIDKNNPTVEDIKARIFMASLQGTDRMNVLSSVDWLSRAFEKSNDLGFLDESYECIRLLIIDYINLAENAADSLDQKKYAQLAKGACLQSMDYHLNLRQTNQFNNALQLYANAHFKPDEISIVDSIYNILAFNNPNSYRVQVNWGTKLNNQKYHAEAIGKFLKAYNMLDTGHVYYPKLINKVINCYLSLDSIEQAFRFSNMLLSNTLKVNFKSLKDPEDFPVFLDLSNDPQEFQKVWDILIVRAELYHKAFRLSGNPKYIDYLNKVEVAFQSTYLSIAKNNHKLKALIAGQQYVDRFFNQAFLDISLELRDDLRAFKYAEIKKSMSTLLLRNHFEWQRSLGSESLSYFTNITDSMFWHKNKMPAAENHSVDDLIMEMQVDSKIDSLLSLGKQIIPDQDIVTLDSVQQKLKTNQHLIEYVFSSDSLYAFKISKKDYDLIALGSRSELNQLIIAMYKSLRSKTFDQALIAQLEELYMKLFEPLLPLKENVIIIPDQHIALVSFAALITSDKTLLSERFLVYDHQISYNYSSTFWIEMLSQASKPNALLGMAPNFKTQSTQLLLNHNMDEVKVVNSMLEGSVYVDSLATRENFLENCNEHSIIHLATHVKVHMEDYLQSSIYFSRADGTALDSIVLSEVYQRPTFANMIYLSACESSVGKNFSGEGIVSIANGFAAGGAKSLISTLWNTNDQIAFDLTKTFYQEVKKGAAKDKALRTAQIQYLKNASASGTHPYYWSGIIPIGDMAPLFNSFDFNSLGLLVVVFVVLIVVSRRIRRHRS